MEIIVMIVAIDGTVSSGKSTVAKLLAKKLKFLYFNTGAVYRAIALIAVKNNLKVDDENKLIETLKFVDICEKVSNDDKFVLTVNGEDVTGDLYTPSISKLSADFAVLPKVREYVRKIQHKIADSTDCVVEGRDIGTIVFPNAEVKFFVTADTEVRAKRRLKDFLSQGKTISYQEVYDSIVKRDEKDTSRSISPLLESKDSILIQNNANSPDLTVKEMIKFVKYRIKNRG